MSYLTLALATSVAGIVPLLIARRPVPALALGIVAFAVEALVYYGNAVSLVWPLLGFPGGCVAFGWLVCALILANSSRRGPGRFFSPFFLLPLGYLAAVAGTVLLGSHLFNAASYAGLLGPVEEREWTRDVQPKDPKHMRMVSLENALYSAKKAVGNAGAIGSQFALAEDSASLQKVRDRLVYAIPFDFAGFSQWQSSSGSPGYILVDAQDPDRAPQLVELPEGRRMRYTPGAYFDQELERDLRQNGCLALGLEKPRFEIDEDNRPWWVVPLYRLGIWWDGETIVGVAVVDPATGEIRRYSVAEVPAWIDRVFPGNLVESYIDERGSYAGGWWNSFWSQRALTTSEQSILVYGSDNRLQWVTGVTSTNEKDDSLIGLMYTDSRNGRTTYYRTNGGATDTAIRQSVDANQQVKFKHLHSSTPQIYNVLGVMTSVVPLLSDNNAFQGLALVRVSNPQEVAVGASQAEALRAYEAVAFRQGQALAVGKGNDVRRLVGIVDRIHQDASGGGSTYLFHLTGVPRIFIASGGEYVKLPLTQPGDRVSLAYIASEEESVSVQEFDNLSLPLENSPLLRQGP